MRADRTPGASVAVLEQLRELYAEQEEKTPQYQERGISISASADEASEPAKKKRNRKIGRGILKQNTKSTGELAELAYMYVAGKNGIANAKPYGDSLPFDQIAITPGLYHLHKVQVRCTAHSKNFIYAVSLMKSGGTKRYEPHEFDFLAALILPEDAWYIIPYEELPPTNEVYLHPRLQPGQVLGRCDAFRDRWDLLKK